MDNIPDTTVKEKLIEIQFGAQRKNMRHSARCSLSLEPLVDAFWLLLINAFQYSDSNITTKIKQQGDNKSYVDYEYDGIKHTYTRLKVPGSNLGEETSYADWAHS
jgi:hypothetical protein